MLEPKKFRFDDYEFEFTPLQLKAARQLYGDLMHYYGGVISAFGDNFELPKDFNLESDVESFVSPSLKSLGNALKEFALSFDADWVDALMKGKLLPNLKIWQNGVEVESNLLQGWYEIEFATKCSLELRLILECLKIQYSDFLALGGNLSTMIQSMIAKTKDSKN